MDNASRPPDAWTEQRFQALTRHSGDIISLLDAEGHLLFNSAAAERISGFTLQELAGIDTFQLIHPEDRERVGEALRQVLAGPGAVVTVQYRYQTKAGGWLWMEAVARNRLEDPELRGIVAISRDISERRAAEEERRASDEQFRTFLAGCDEGFVRIGPDGRVAECNDQLARMVGRGSAAELVGRDPLEFITPAARPEVAEHLQRRREGQSERYVARVQAPDGQQRFLQVSSVPLRDREGAVMGAYAFVTDLTEARAMEARLLQAQKVESLGTLAGGIAHDFNNLLVGVLGAIDLARGELPPDHPALEPLRIATGSANRAAALCRQLLAFAGRAEPQLEPVALAQLLSEAADLLGVSAGRHIELRRELAPHLPAVAGDAVQLRQVLLNLVTNAAEATPAQGGAIALRAELVEVDRATLDGFQLGAERAPGRFVRVQVHDQGRGMEPEVLARIFDPFFSTKAAGRGLGLAATMGVIRRHGGCLRVDSAPGRGTTFTLLLPPASAPAAAAAPARPVPAAARWRGQGRILVVDDEELVRRVARRLLERLGFEVDEAPDGLAAVEAVASNPARHAAVLLDLTMPRLDGLGALNRLRELAPALPVFLSSGLAGGEAREKAAALRADFVEKPYDGAALEKALRERLG
ncbi:MAG: PAS domain S-box protein [Anaeromyxobacter sp.]